MSAMKKRVIAINRADGSIIGIWDSLAAAGRACNEPTNNLHQKLNRPWWDSTYMMSYIDSKGTLETYNVIEKEIIDAVKQLDNSDDEFVKLNKFEYADFVMAKPYSRNVNLDHLADEPEDAKVLAEIESMTTFLSDHLAPSEAEESKMSEEAQLAEIEAREETNYYDRDILDLFERKLELAEEMERIDAEINTHKSAWERIGKATGWLQ
jgi:hypothetical protein